ncbi:hypothetical protein [Streptomyces viridochromogenes]|uniref:hypothetical protein n=1 Tax=Streptomyces viridochromogenes TaxID=1938 RepID=UPI0031CE0D7E
MSFLLKGSVNEFGFELGDAVLGEPAVSAATFETLSQFAVLLGQMADPSLQCRVLGHHGLDGFTVPGGRLGVTKLAHEFPDAQSLGSDLALCAGQPLFGFEGPLASGPKVLGVEYQMVDSW